MSHAHRRPIAAVPHPLHVVAVVSNSRRYLSRYALFRDFARRMACNPAVELTVVELALGDRPHELCDVPCARRVKLRSNEELWHKENLVNIGVRHLPADWRYMAWIDADVDFARPDWAEETVHQLQHHQVVQPWSRCLDLGPDYLPTRKHANTRDTLWPGFAYAHHRGIPASYTHGPEYEFAHPGFAWAIRRETFDRIGGLLDFCGLGSADHLMALAFAGYPGAGVHGGMNAAYRGAIHRWGERAFRVVQGDLGFCDGLLLHHWHGPKTHRRYVERWQVLIDGGFDPATDLVPDSQGVYQLAPGKPELRRNIQRYFSQRDEDCRTSDLEPL